jgi:hypothetical protein
VPIARLVSGGQTGADRAALDVALALGIPHGGWVPRGRRAEDGPLDHRYRVRETPSADPAQRTAWNVRDSDATLILSRGPLAGGSALTRRLALESGCPLLHLDLARLDTAAAAGALADWLAGLVVATLNVAGPRASEDPGIYAAAYALLSAVLAADARR